MSKPKVAIVHDFLVQHGGAEKTVEAICEIFPDAPIYTAIYKPKNFRGTVIEAKEVFTAGHGANKILTAFPILGKYFTFLLPIVFENFDLSKYDIVISSSASYAKGVLTNPNQLHISYIHTPPRFLYGYSVESTQRNAWYYKPVVMLVDHYLKMWDFIAAQRANYLVTNSKNVQNRISKFYKRESTVIYPPVELSYAEKQHKKDSLEQPYYYALGRLSAYKNFDFLVEAFNLLGINLKIMGGGYEERKLRKMANDNVKVLGKVSDKKKHKIIENSLGYIFPAEDEDFGIVILEALSHGKPVFSHKSGGPLEIIREGKDGMFFGKLDLALFANEFKVFDKKVRSGQFNGDVMKKYILKFSKKEFKKNFKDFVIEKWEGLNA